MARLRITKVNTPKEEYEPSRLEQKKNAAMKFKGLNNKLHCARTPLIDPDSRFYPPK